MNPSTLLLIVIVLAVAVFILWPRYKLHQALKKPFPPEWRKILRQNLPIFRQMPTDLQLQLKRRIKRFVHEKRFIGCGGLEITDEIRITIAAAASLLLVNRSSDGYGGLRYILVYPEAFQAAREEVDGAGLSHLVPRGLLGESWSNGKVVLSWEDVQRGNRNLSDGGNVAIHEFAHQLDHESGATNGAPFFGSASRSQRWASVLTEE